MRRSLYSMAQLGMLALLGPWHALPQVILPPEKARALQNSDLAVLESREVRSDLPCSLTPLEPVLGFDLRFHAGYAVQVPLTHADANKILTILFRITAEEDPNHAVYLAQHAHVPRLSATEAEPVKGGIAGIFDLGEGRYHVDWLLRDPAWRVCSFHWSVAVAPPARQQKLFDAFGPLGRASVAAFNKDRYVPESPSQDSPRGPVAVSLLVNLSPQDQTAPRLRPDEIGAIVGVLRSLARQTSIAEFSLVAFNLSSQEVLYRQPRSNAIDLPRLGEAMDSMRAGTVDLKQLQHPNAEAEFLTRVIAAETTASPEPGILIFVGSRRNPEDQPRQKPAHPLLAHHGQVFYVDYNPDPAKVPWNDTIGETVRSAGGRQITIRRPLDVLSAAAAIQSVIEARHRETPSPLPQAGTFR